MSLSTQRNIMQRKESRVADEGKSTKRQCLESAHDKIPTGFVSGSQSLEKRSKMYFLKDAVTDDLLRYLFDRNNFKDVSDVLEQAQKDGKAKRVEFLPAPQVFDTTNNSGHRKKTKVKKNQRTCSTRKFLFELHLDLYLAGDGEHYNKDETPSSSECFILAGDGEHLRSRIRMYIIEVAFQKLEELESPSKKKQKGWVADPNARQEIINDARMKIFDEISSFIMKYWNTRDLKCPRLKKSSAEKSQECEAFTVKNTFVHDMYPTTLEDLPRPLGPRAYTTDDYPDWLNTGSTEVLKYCDWLKTGSLLDLMRDFEINIKSRLACIAQFLGDPDKPKSQASKIREQFLSDDGAGDELLKQMKHRLPPQMLVVMEAIADQKEGKEEWMRLSEMFSALEASNKPVNKFVLSSEQILKCRQSSCSKHHGYYLGKQSQVRKCLGKHIDPDLCLDARSQLPVQFVCVNGNFSPNPEEQIQPNGKHLLVCPLCQGQTHEQMKSKGSADCHCRRLYGEEPLYEHECELVEAIVPAHLHNLVVGPSSCIRSNSGGVIIHGALDLNNFILFAQLHAYFGGREAIDMIDSSDPRGAARKRGHIVKTVQLVAYRPALCTFK